MYWRVRCYCGPTLVDHYVDHLTAAGYPHIIAGTAHVHFDCPDRNDGSGCWGAMQDVRTRTGLPIRPGDYSVIRWPDSPRWTEDAV